MAPLFPQDQMQYFPWGSLLGTPPISWALLQPNALLNNSWSQYWKTKDYFNLLGKLQCQQSLQIALKMYFEWNKAGWEGSSIMSKMEGEPSSNYWPWNGWSHDIISHHSWWEVHRKLIQFSVWSHWRHLVWIHQMTTCLYTARVGRKDSHSSVLAHFTAAST